MTRADQGPETTLRLTRTFAARRERVFRAWTDPEELMRWFGPSDEYAVPHAEVDLRVGGKYRIELKTPSGRLLAAVGTYREVRPPERLVFTWSWTGTETDPAETLVTVELHDRGGSTELALTHERFPNKAERDGHATGWSGSLERLGRRLH